MKALIVATLVLCVPLAPAEESTNSNVPNDTAQPSPTEQIPEGSFLLDRPSFKTVPLPRPAPPQREKNEMKDFLKEFPLQKFTPAETAEMNQRFKNYDAEKRQQGQFTPGDFSKCAGGKCPFEEAARRCGEDMQRLCSPARLGTTMCGMAVGKMLECMKGNIPGASAGCTGRCGHGKMFVACDNGQMKNCGYQKLSPNDNKCKMPGAVLAYSQSPTTRGRAYGHVEFVCGQGRYCSVYSQPHGRPWPYPVPDACWYPAQGGST